MFTGGFPRPAVLAAIRRLAADERLPVYHWGDIDAGGVTIFRTIELALGGRLQPHLMMPALAEHDGHPIKADRRLATISESGSAIARLAEWLMRPDARKLEQEALSPVSPLNRALLDAYIPDPAM